MPLDDAVAEPQRRRRRGRLAGRAPCPPVAPAEPRRRSAPGARSPATCSGPARRSRSCSRSSRVGAGYWQVVEAQRLSTAADNPAVIAIARRALRGPIIDRNDRWLARSERDANGEALREYRDDALSHVVGYASRQYGTTGLERAYNAELIGLVVGRRSAACSASSTRRPTSRSASRRRSTSGSSGRPSTRWATTGARS